MSYDYWLGRLMDDNDIRSVSDAQRLFASTPDLRELFASYTQEVEPLADLPPSSDPTIVAGSALDLSGDLDCSHPDCMMGRVDDLFGKVWHYFDRVVVTGASAAQVSNEDADPDQMARAILPHIQTLLYLRSIGGEDMLVFRDKEHWCSEHLPEAANSLGLGEISRNRELHVEAIVSRDNALADTPRFDGESWNGWISLPWGGVWPFSVDLPSDATEDQILWAAAEQEFHVVADHFTGDVLRADRYQAPLAVVHSVHEEWLKSGSASSNTPSEIAVALQLQLPILSNASPADILRLRREEGDSFKKFQKAVRTATQERVAAARAGDSNASIARDIVGDVIEPALNDIRRGMKSATRTMTRKSAARLVLGVTSVTTGLLTGVPAVLAAGAGVLASGASILPPIDKFFDEKREIELKDMYFLWQAERKSPAV